MKLQKKLFCKDCEMRVWDNLRGEKKYLKLLINTWNTLLSLFPVNTSFPRGRTISEVYQRRIFCFVSVLLVEAVSPAERGELEVSSPRQEWAVRQQVPMSSSKHESAAPGGCSSAPVTSPDQGCRLPLALLAF